MANITVHNLSDQLQDLHG